MGGGVKLIINRSVFKRWNTTISKLSDMLTVHTNVDGKLKNLLPFKNEKHGIGVQWLHSDNRTSAHLSFQRRAIITRSCLWIMNNNIVRSLNISSICHYSGPEAKAFDSLLIKLYYSVRASSCGYFVPRFVRYAYVLECIHIKWCRFPDFRTFVSQNDQTR